MLGPGNNSSRGPDMPPLPECLPLDPIILDCQKYTRSGELRRVLGVSLGSTSEDHAFRANYPKPAPPVATEELKNFKDSVQDASRKARDRAKMLRESIFKLDKYWEGLSSRKRQRTYILSSERSGGASLSKMGSQILRIPQDQATQRSEDKSRSVGPGLKKRIRTSMINGRVDGRSAVISRQQIVMGKDRDVLKIGGDIQIEEKIRKLPAGGEGWEKKMKRKRSVGTVGNRGLNGERDLKEDVHPKMTAHTKLRTSDALGFRSRSAAGMSGIDKAAESSEPTNSKPGPALRNELENVASLRDPTTILDERVLSRGNNMLSHEENSAGSPSNMTKGKISRTQKASSVITVDLSPHGHQSSGALEAWELSSTQNKAQVVGVTNQHKRPQTIGSSAQPMAGWVGQRPHKILRTKRTNVASPVANNDEPHISSQTCMASDQSAKYSSHDTNKSAESDNPKFKIKLEKIPSPVGLYEGEESGGRENSLKEKGSDIAVSANLGTGSFLLPSRKNKAFSREETGNGGQGQRRMGRFLSSSRPSGSDIMVEVERVPTTKQLQSMKRGSDKNRSKLGRPPVKKLKDRKTLTRAGPVLNSGNLVFAGELDDDREELLAAANSARNASHIACSGPFWKKMEPIFASISTQDALYLKQQLSFAEEMNDSLGQMFGDEFNLAGVIDYKKASTYSGGKSCLYDESSRCDGLSEGFNMGRKLDKVPSLYQRVLSALIDEDESEEIYHQNEGRNISFQSASDDSHCGSCNHIDVEPKDMDRMESEVESEVDFQAQKQCLLDRLSCNRSASSNTHSNRSVSSSLCNNEQWQADDGLSSLDAGHASRISQNDLYAPNFSPVNASDSSAMDCQYQMLCLDDRLLLELQSIGLYPETMPDLTEGEEGLYQDIVELQGGLLQEVGKIKKYLGKIDRDIQYSRDLEMRDIEQVAMNHLVVMAYRKRMACRGSNSLKSMARRVPKELALPFVKRTLARCHEFEETGRSCFSEPPLKDVVFCTTLWNKDVNSIDCAGSGAASSQCDEACNHKAAAGNSANDAACSIVEKHDYYSAGKKKEVLLDNFVGGASRKASSNNAMRSEQEKNLVREMVTTNSMPGSGCPSLNSVRGERKPKSKPKQKTDSLSTSGNGLHGRTMEARNSASLAVGGPSQEQVGWVSSAHPEDSSKEEKDPIDFANLPLCELDSIDLGMNNDLGGAQDLGSWLTFEEDGLLDHDSIGLEIPMDDLSDLNMLM